MSLEAEHSRRVLVIDDDEGVRSSLKLLLKTHFHVETAENAAEAERRLQEFQPDLVLLDVMMPDCDGLDVLRSFRDQGIRIPVIMLTAAHEVRTAVEAMKLGALDYLSKPFDVEELTSVMVKVLSNTDAQEASSKIFVRQDKDEEKQSALMGNSNHMRELRELISQVAPKDASILITGESGTGKELVARRIHAESLRAQGPFVTVHCAAIPETLIETELFGHEKGAFTSASEDRIGLCQQAHGGTLFLDEIGELPLAMQVKILRFLQEREFYRVGSSKPRSVDVRIIAATNKNLEQAVEGGSFRSDLFYRIHVIHIPLPSLRERFEDIPVLLQYFIDRYSPRYAGKSISFTPEAEQTLVRYDWPGNVRELENLIESLLALSVHNEIAPEHLPPRFLFRQQRDAGDGRARISEKSGKLGFTEEEKHFETEMIAKALQRTGGQEDKAAEILGVSPRILRYKMEKFGISR